MGGTLGRKIRQGKHEIFIVNIKYKNVMQLL